VQVHGGVDAARLDAERVVEAGRGPEHVEAPDEVGDRLEPAGHGEHEPVVGTLAPDRVQGGHGDEQVAELEGAERQELGGAVGVGQSSHGPTVAHAPAARPTRRAQEEKVICARLDPAAPGQGDGMTRSARASGPRSAVLFDRDATLVVDVPYNGDPALVVPVEGAQEAVDAVRAAGHGTGVVTNQSGVGDGRITLEQAQAVNARVDELVGPIDVWELCPHHRDAGCACRKPAPGMVLRAAERLGVDPARVVVIGDIGADVGAARAAGATGILVPTPITRQEEVDAAEHVAADLAEAVRLALAHLDALPVTDGATP
jgi:D-glycero-D-manno-heptose 1,7-bisphosphate phosphatase